MEEVTLVESILTVYIPQVLVYWYVLKGVASKVAEYGDTQEWGRIGKIIELLASNTQKAKLTGVPEIDDKLEAIARENLPKTALGKILKAIG